MPRIRRCWDFYWGVESGGAACPIAFGRMTALSQGRSAEGDEWQLMVRDRPGLDGSVTSTSIRVVSAGGRISQGGYGERSLAPDQRFDWYGGRDDESGPNHVILRLARDVASVRVRLSDGRLEQPDLVDHPVHQDARVAGLVFPRALDIVSVELLDSDGRVIVEEEGILACGRPGPPG